MMEFLGYYFAAVMFTTVIMTILTLTSDAFNGVGFVWLNPVWIYKTIKVNWFGAVFIALAGNIALPIYAIGYWFYKLCTVGRR